MNDFDGIPVISEIYIPLCHKLLAPKADADNLYIPFVPEDGNGINAFYLKIDKRLLKIGEVQE